MKRKHLRRLSLLSAWMLMATIPQNILPMVEAERIRIEKSSENL